MFEVSTFGIDLAKNVIQVHGVDANGKIMVRCRSRHAGKDWLSRKLATKETKVVAIALANRMARTIFALLRDGTSYNPRVSAV